MANYDDTEDWKVKINRKKEMKNLLEECDETYVVENSSLVKDTDEDVDSGISSFSGILTRKSMIWARDSIDKLPIKMTLGNIGAFALFFAILMPKTFTYVITYPIFRLVLGNLYPAYSSYKAVRTKNVKEYVKWMMYWIVFAIFTLVETFADILVSFWFPFYYEIKIIFLLWLLCPATKGSSIIYRRFLHPTLTEREAEIDEAIAKVTEQGYTAVLQLGSKGVNYATTVLMQTAIKNLSNKAINQASQGTSTTDSVSAISSSASSSKTSSMDTRTDHLDGVVPQKTTTAGLRRRQLRELESSDDDDDDYQESMDIGDKTAKKIAEALENDDDYISDDSVEFLDDSERTENEFVSKVKIEPQVGMNLRSRKKKVYSLHYESDDSLDY